MSVWQRFPQTLIFDLKWQNMKSLWRHSLPTYHRCEFLSGQHDKFLTSRASSIDPHYQVVPWDLPTRERREGQPLLQDAQACELFFKQCPESGLFRGQFCVF